MWFHFILTPDWNGTLSVRFSPNAGMALLPKVVKADKVGFPSFFCPQNSSGSFGKLPG